MTERDEYTPSLYHAADLYVRAREQPAHDAGHLPAKYPDEYRAEFDRMIEAVRAEERERCARRVAVTEEMVERAARVLHPAGLGPWDEAKGAWRERTLMLARAALEAALAEKGDGS